MQLHSENKTIRDDAVRQYFDQVGEDQVSASYMAHEVDLPLAASCYRLNGEKKVLEVLLSNMPKDGSVLDLGCGAGTWSEFFASRFERVIAVDRSRAMIRAASKRLSQLSNVEVRCSDDIPTVSDAPFNLVFLGGFCMYQNDVALVQILDKLRSLLSSGGVIIARESTVTSERLVRNGKYQAIYRTPDDYKHIFQSAGFKEENIKTQRNVAYDHMNIAGQLVVTRRKYLPFLPKRSQILGAATWHILRATAPLSFHALPWTLDRMSINWPILKNHFFALTHGSLKEGVR